jgi:hypothetical protein
MILLFDSNGECDNEGNVGLIQHHELSITVLRS